MALIPQDPKQQKALIGVLAAAGLAYAFATFWRTPQVEELTAQQERLERLEGQNQAAELRALQKERLERQAAVYERYVRQLETLVPAEEEVPALLRDIQAEARRLDIDLNLIEPIADQPGAYYTKQAYTMRIIGEYHDVGQFLTTVASLPRIITPVDVAVAPFQNDDLIQYDSGIVVDFEIETYVLPVGAPAPMAGDSVAGSE